jgi:rhodanese-related sulfurtransferase
VSSTSSRIDRDRLQQLVSEEQAQLVDVLSRSAYEALHLPHAINIPLKDLDEKAVEQLDRSRPVIVYCYDHQ